MTASHFLPLSALRSVGAVASQLLHVLPEHARRSAAAVEDRDGVSTLQRVAHLMRADEASAAKDENALGREAGAASRDLGSSAAAAPSAAMAPANEFAPALHGMDSENVSGIGALLTSYIDRPWMTCRRCNSSRAARGDRSSVSTSRRLARTFDGSLIHVSSFRVRPEVMVRLTTDVLLRTLIPVRLPSVPFLNRSREGSRRTVELLFEIADTHEGDMP